MTISRAWLGEAQIAREPVAQPRRCEQPRRLGQVEGRAGIGRRAEQRICGPAGQQDLHQGLDHGAVGEAGHPNIRPAPGIAFATDRHRLDAVSEQMRDDGMAGFMNRDVPQIFRRARIRRHHLGPQIRFGHRTICAPGLAPRRIPLGRLGKPDDCAGLALLLCSPEGDYLNGAEIAVDGGLRL